MLIDSVTILINCINPWVSPFPESSSNLLLSPDVMLNNCSCIDSTFDTSTKGNTYDETIKTTKLPEPGFLLKKYTVPFTYKPFILIVTYILTVL